MNQGETLIIILLAVIAYLLYQIAKQLTYITGVKMKTPFGSFIFKKPTKHKPLPKEDKEDLPN